MWFFNRKQLCENACCTTTLQCGNIRVSQLHDKAFFNTLFIMKLPKTQHSSYLSLISSPDVNSGLYFTIILLLCKGFAVYFNIKNSQLWTLRINSLALYISFFSPSSFTVAFTGFAGHPAEERATYSCTNKNDEPWQCLAAMSSTELNY